MIKAIVYIPPSTVPDMPETDQRVIYALRRGYDLTTICQSWDVAHSMLLAGWANVVILAQCNHGALVTAESEILEADGALATVAILANRRRRRRPAASALPLPRTAEALIDETILRWQAETAAWGIVRNMRRLP